ncbi:hypothetical protein [Pseudomonas sp. NPDC089401]|uniref:DUF7716 domain-containing protein n=1 Tax=Pseudomonas sp. NPDC089401 TaxID=3364462 RepID=UPI0037F77062
MDTFRLNTVYPLETLIHLVKSRQERDEVYALYCPVGIEELACGQTIYVGDVPDYDEEDNEHLPRAVMAMGYTFCYMRDQFQDVIDLAVSQKASVSDQELIECLNYYAEYDDFFDVAP